MSYERFPLRLNVGFLINAPISTNREVAYDFADFSLGNDLSLKNLIGKANFTRTPKGIYVQAKFTASTIAECVRCLDEFEQKLFIDFGELYAFNPNSVTESGLILQEDANIDLQPLLREYLLIEFPIKTVCDEDCKGLCTVCGENLNQQTCEHQVRNLEIDQ